MKAPKNSIFLFAFLFNFISYAQTSNETIENLRQQTDAIITINENNKVAEFVRFPFNKPLSLQGNSLQEKVNNFLNQYKAIYKLTSIQNSLTLEEIKTDNYGFKTLILKQIYNGIPIFDGELRFHFNQNDKLTAINGNFIPTIKIDSTPSITIDQANNIAIQSIENQTINNSGEQLKVITNKLYIFQKGLAQGYNNGNYLVYEVEVNNNNDVREFLYIDAHSGNTIEQFTGIADALDRVLYETNTSTTTWSEGDSFPGALDIWQQNEVVAAGHMYNLFKNTFGYISYDNADAQMQTINNNPNISCPNANWNGVTANYCTGTASDDVVAHEWGHAYTQYTSGLIYAWQSGAINESYSDIWGETVDILNNYEDSGEDFSLRTGCSSSDRWRIGEDASAFGGAIRDMWNPTCNGDPGKVTDGQYRCSTADSGGVHSNSGIPNHAYALLVDGGTYNGQTITGIGFTKAAHIFWRAQSNYLTSTSDFSSLADALEASCNDLLGINLQGLSTSTTPSGLSGEIITTSDCDEVAKVILAVEFRINPDACGFTPILSPVTQSLCGAASSNPVFYEDWESGTGNWIIGQLPVNSGTWEPREWALDSSLPNGRTGQGIFGPDPIIGNCTSDLENGTIRLQSPLITIPDVSTGIFEMSFNHYIATESTWDGGNIKYSLDGGAWTVIPGTSFTTNPYNNTLQTTAAGNDNPMQGQEAFTGTDGGSNSSTWGQSTVDLSSLGVVANSTIQFRFEVGTDGCNGNDGWYLDEIVVYNCSDALAIDKFNQMIEGVKVYPNPSNGIITIQKTNQLDLIDAKIFDVNGRMIKSIDLANMIIEKQIDISNFSQGIYFITVTSNHATGNMKLIKN